MAHGSPELVIILALLAAARDRHDPDWCRKKFVGKLRSMIGGPLPPGVSGITEAEFGESQRRAASILEAHCLSCRRCPLGRE